jgi:sugar/nucleoside kinase (ribokinase family)
VICGGILVADLFIQPLARLPLAGELVATDDFLLDTGGCAANVATCLARLGISVGVSGKIGTDLFGDFILRDMAQKGVDEAGITRSLKHGTSKTVILPVIGEDRRYVHTFGANIDFHVDDFDRNAIARSKVFYVGGFLILPELTQSGLRDAFQLARESGAKTVLDVVVPSNKQVTMDALAEVLPCVDCFLPNDEEALHLTGERDLHRQAKRFINAGCTTVVITRGSHGALLMDAQQTIEAGTFKVDVVDGSGSGDAFAGGFILGLLEGWPMERALRFASAMGASACTALGCNAGLFSRPQADAFLQTHALNMRVHNREAQ